MIERRVWDLSSHNTTQSSFWFFCVKLRYDLTILYIFALAKALERPALLIMQSFFYDKLNYTHTHISSHLYSSILIWSPSNNAFLHENKTQLELDFMIMQLCIVLYHHSHKRYYDFWYSYSGVWFNLCR